MDNVISLASRHRQQRGETLREISVQGRAVHIVTTTPDGARITEILTPDEAREWAEELVDCAADAETCRR